ESPVEIGRGEGKPGRKGLLFRENRARSLVIKGARRDSGLVVMVFLAGALREVPFTRRMFLFARPFAAGFVRPVLGGFPVVFEYWRGILKIL
ncbi:MAG: hypothetical protein ACM3PY_07965, partial [Omnitrophica WOR_2 bacterium]